MADQTDNLSLPYIMPAQAQKHVTHNESLRILDALVQLAVIDRDRTSPPAMPAPGDRHIVATAAEGSWAGHEGEIAIWQDGGWFFLTPRDGWLAWVVAEDAATFRKGDRWVELSTAISTLQHIALLGIGTAADAASPFSARLNKALWAALPVADGGSGDLRYTLNKEAASNVLSLLFQSDWLAHAEFGLLGNDDVVLKVSPDGTNWLQALSIANASGTATMRNVRVESDEGISFDIDMEGSPAGSGVFRATRYSSNTSGPVLFGRKARGTRAVPEAVQAGDTLLGFRGYGYSGTDFLSASAGVAFLLEAAENFVHGSNYGTQIRFFTTENATTANVERMRIADNGDLQMGGANTVISASRHPMLRAYVAAALPAASPAGQLIYVSDGASSKRLAVSDGADWRWPDGTIVS